MGAFRRFLAGAERDLRSGAEAIVATVGLVNGEHLAEPEQERRTQRLRDERVVVVWELLPRWVVLVGVGQAAFAVRALVGASGWDVGSGVAQLAVGLGLALGALQGRVFVSDKAVVVRPLWRTKMWSPADVDRGIVPDGEFHNLLRVQRAVRDCACDESS